MKRLLCKTGRLASCAMTLVAPALPLRCPQRFSRYAHASSPWSAPALPTCAYTSCAPGKRWAQNVQTQKQLTLVQFAPRIAHRCIQRVFIRVQCGYEARGVQVLKERAEAFLGEAVDEIVMTVPSEYSIDQRLATMDTAALCSISRVSLLQACFFSNCIAGQGIRWWQNPHTASSTASTVPVNQCPAWLVPNCSVVGIYLLTLAVLASVGVSRPPSGGTCCRNLWPQPWHMGWARRRRRSLPSWWLT